jgi:hypothetical protein
MTMGKIEARAKVAEYLKSVRGRHTREDEEILRGYRALARGKTVIDLPSVIGRGGIFEATGLPKLAIATADHQFVWCSRGEDGWVHFMPAPTRDINERRTKDCFRLPINTLQRMAKPATVGVWWQDQPWNGYHRAMVPHVPPGLRPNVALSNYAVLFEVDEWKRDPQAPRDPALLKHLGGDLYAVLATWDLSELERSVLNGRTRRG